MGRVALRFAFACASTSPGPYRSSPEHPPPGPLYALLSAWGIGPGPPPSEVSPPLSGDPRGSLRANSSRRSSSRSGSASSRRRRSSATPSCSVLSAILRRACSAPSTSDSRASEGASSWGGIRSRAAASNLRASAWAWRSASSWSRSVAMVSSLADMSAERAAIRLRPVGVLSRSCRVLDSVQHYPYPAVWGLLVGDRAPLDALSDSVNGRAEELSGFADASTLAGRMSCRVLSLSHTRDTRPLGPEPKGLRSPPRHPDEGIPCLFALRG